MFTRKIEWKKKASVFLVYGNYSILNLLSLYLLIHLCLSCPEDERLLYCNGDYSTKQD